MTTLFSHTVNKGAINDFSLQPPQIVFTMTLAADTAQSITLPGDAATGIAATKLTNSFEVVFYVQDGKNVGYSTVGTAVIPPGSAAQTSTEMIRSGMGRYMREGTVISFITHDASAVVSVSVFSVNN